MSQHSSTTIPASVELVGEPRWARTVGRSAKAIVATLTPAVALGGTLGALLPAAQAAPIAAGVSIVTGLITWLTANTGHLKAIAGSTEEFVEDVTGRDV